MQQNITNTFLHPPNLTFTMTLSYRPLLYSVPPKNVTVRFPHQIALQNERIPNILPQNFTRNVSSKSLPWPFHLKPTSLKSISESTLPNKGVFDSRNKQPDHKHIFVSLKRRRKRRTNRKSSSQSRYRRIRRKGSSGTSERSVYLLGSQKKKQNQQQQDQPQTQDQQQQHQQDQQQYHTSMKFSEWYPLIPLTLVTFILNGMVCYLYKHNKNISKKSTNVLLLNQAFGDVFSGITYVPAYIISFYYPEIDYLRSTVFMYSIFLSICCLLLLAFERLWSILKPLQHFSFWNRSALLKGIILIWALPLPVSLINLVWGIQESRTTAYTIYLWIFWALLVTASITIVIVYVITLARTRNITHKRYRKRNTNSNSGSYSGGSADDLQKLRFKQELRVTWLGIALFFFHIIGYYPTVVVNLLSYIDKYYLIKKEIAIFTSYSYVLNGIFNPLLCFAMKRDYRIALLKTITHSRRARSRSAITFLKTLETIKISND